MNNDGSTIITVIAGRNTKGKARKHETMTARRRIPPKKDSPDGKEEPEHGNGRSRAGRIPTTTAMQVHQEGMEWGSPGPTRIVKKLAMYRFVIFCILIREHVSYLPQRPFSDANEDNEGWFTYDQFDFFYHWAPKVSNPVWGAEACHLLYYLGIVAGVMAALGGTPQMAYSFEFAGSLMLFLYAFRFLAFAEMYTNHSYLFGLLAFLVILSGGGSYYPPTDYDLNNSNNNNNNDRLQRLIQKSEWGAILVRIQYAVVYFFASIWKVTPDWLDGTICKGIFITFQEQGVSRGIPWKELYEKFGSALFRLVALGGLALDTGMFLALALRRPAPKTTRLFSTLSVLFHGFVGFTMSQRIGYTFPACCLAGSLIFQPIGSDETDGDKKSYAISKKDDDFQFTGNGSIHKSNTHGSKAPPVAASPVSEEYDEANLIIWIYRYIKGEKEARVSKVQRYFALFWFAFQMAMPLRMPIISQGSFPFTSRCYRFSWTMMLHSRNAVMLHSGYHTLPDGTVSDERFFIPMDMINLYPECADVVPFMRTAYQPKSVFPNGDPRTIPMIAENHGVIGIRQRALVEQFPRYVARAAGGWSDVLYHKAPDACYNKGLNDRRRMSVYGVVYSKLNNKGAFYRLFDPTVNLALAEQARKERSLWERFKGVLLDQGPPGYEYLLTKGVGSMNPKIEDHRKALEQKYPLAKRIEFIADRTQCLAARPLSLWPGGFPLVAVALEVPERVTLHVSRRQLPEGTSPERQWEDLSDPVRSAMPLNTFVSASASIIEFRTTMNSSVSFKQCGQTTEEDILFALLFMA